MCDLAATGSHAKPVADLYPVRREQKMNNSILEC